MKKWKEPTAAEKEALEQIIRRYEKIGVEGYDRIVLEQANEIERYRMQIEGMKTANKKKSDIIRELEERLEKTGEAYQAVLDTTAGEGETVVIVRSGGKVANVEVCFQEDEKCQ